MTYPAPAWKTTGVPAFGSLQCLAESVPPHSTIALLYGAIVARGSGPGLAGGRRPFVPEETMTEPYQRWHLPVRLDDVAESGLHLDLVADEAVRARLGALAGLRDLPRLEAGGDPPGPGNGFFWPGGGSA